MVWSQKARWGFLISLLVQRSSGVIWSYFYHYAISDHCIMELEEFCDSLEDKVSNLSYG